MAFEFDISQDYDHGFYYCRVSAELVFKNTNKKKLKSHLVEYKRIFKDNLRTLLRLQSNAHDLYKSNYFELSNDVHLFIFNSFKTFDERFNFLFRRSQMGVNDAVGTVHLCYGYLISSVEKMLIFANKHKIYSLKNQCEALRKMLYEFERFFTLDCQSLANGDDYKRTVPPLMEKPKKAKNEQDFNHLFQWY